MGIAVSDGAITSATKVLKLSARTNVYAMRDAIPTYTRGSEGGAQIDARLLADTDTTPAVPNATTANGGAIYATFPHVVYAAYHSYYGTGGTMKAEYKDPADGTWKLIGNLSPTTYGGSIYAQSFRWTAVDDSNTGMIGGLFERGYTEPPLVSASALSSYTVKRGTAASLSIAIGSNLHFGGAGYVGTISWSPPSSTLTGLSITDPGAASTTVTASAATTLGWTAGSYTVTIQASDSRSTSLPKSFTVNVTN